MDFKEFNRLNEQDRIARAAAAVLRVPVSEIAPRVQALVQDVRNLRDQLVQAENAMAQTLPADRNVEIVNGRKFFSRVVHGFAQKELLQLVDEWKSRLGSGIVAIANVHSDGRCTLVVGVTNDLAYGSSGCDRPVDKPS